VDSALWKFKYNYRTIILRRSAPMSRYLTLFVHRLCPLRVKMNHDSSHQNDCSMEDLVFSLTHIYGA